MLGQRLMMSDEASPTSSDSGELLLEQNTRPNVSAQRSATRANKRTIEKLLSLEVSVETAAAPTARFLSARRA